MAKPKIAIVRGKFLNRYEMQFFEPLVRDFDITAFGSLMPYHDHFAFPVVKLPSPMDLPEFPYKMGVLNRLFVDAHYLWGLEERLQGFDLVHSAETYFHYTQQALNAKKKGYVKKVIATVLENIPFNNESIWGRKAFKARARNELDHIIALTNKTKEALLAEGADPKKVTVISHFVDTKRFHPVQKKNTKHVTVLFVGRLEEEKGVLDIVQAARLLPGVRFLFVGDGSLGGRVEHRSVSYDEMPSVYQQADIFVAPSKSTPTWEEQYNTALLEAQASGLPIVTTRSGGIPENVGDAAIIVPPGDVGAIATALKRFIFSPSLRKQYGQKARRRAETVHDIKIGASKLKDLYLSLLS
ncbi:glycosyltransferase family 4 protein [Candidatus Gottesmanbacteria bacterium]|nr:glycosyltransferase family 4 protein [Candidatus Gottesmanbacteria bacterium]